MKSEKHYIARIIAWQGIELVNICDEELIGKTINGGKIEISVSKDYFGGESVCLDKALKLVKSSAMVNLVGNRIISEVLRAKLASKNAVKKVDRTSFLMIFKF